VSRVGSTLGPQIEAGDLGVLAVLALQQWHKQLIQSQSQRQHGGLIGWLAGVSRVVNGVATLGGAADGEDRKPVLFVVITGVVAKRTFQRVRAAVSLAICQL